jgi:hypothetical protein
MGGIIDKTQSFIGGGTGYTQATGNIDPYKEITAQQIDPRQLQQSITDQAGQQKEQNINAFNSAVASQRGVSPTISAMLMGNNLANANQQASQVASNLGAQAGFQAQQANQQANLQAHQINSNNYNASKGMNQASSENAANRSTQLIGGAMSGGAAAMTLLSDERIKEKKKKLNPDDDDNAVNEFLDSLTPHSYQYKEGSDGDDGGRKHLGIMAQNVEGTEAGEGIVGENGNGTKQLDVAQLTGSLAAGLGAIHRRLRQIEGRSGK